jgi:hypothetical protein
MGKCRSDFGSFKVYILRDLKVALQTENVKKKMRGRSFRDFQKKRTPQYKT